MKKFSRLQNKNIKLSLNQIKDIKRLYGTGSYTYIGLGKMFNVSKSTIGYYVNPNVKKQCQEHYKKNRLKYIKKRKEHVLRWLKHRDETFGESKYESVYEWQRKNKERRKIHSRAYYLKNHDKILRKVRERYYEKR